MKKCWANSLWNCDWEITREHIVSNVILNKTMLVKGFSWCKDEFKEVSASSLTSKILCEKHNYELSNFDSEAKNFVTIVDEYYNKEKYFSKFWYRNNNIPIVYKINWLLLEKWCCKTLVNFAYIWNTDNPIIFEKLLPYIYQNKRFEQPYGLYFDATIWLANHQEFLEINPFFNSIGELGWAIFIFKWFRLRLNIPNSMQIESLDSNRYINEINENNIINKVQYNWHNQWINYSKQLKKWEKILQKINIKR